MYSSIGFRKYISKRDFDLDEIIGMGLSDRSFFAQTASILENTPKPFYAFLVTLSSHYPFNYPPLIAQSKLDVGEFGNTLVGNYLKSMNYLDEQFGMFLDELKKKGLLKSSVIVIYGDHTAVPKWDAANLEKLLGKDLKSAHSWRDLLKVPLIIRTPDPNSVKFMNSERACGLVDLPKSAALLLGVEYHCGFGKNVFEDVKVPVIFRNGSYIYDFAYVEPSLKKAVDLRDGKILEYSHFQEISKDTAKELAYSDKILAHDLIPSIFERIGEE
jgi:phosphoglycerol transferase MdoB-like AlkP superfamily enzyme